MNAINYQRLSYPGIRKAKCHDESDGRISHASIVSSWTADGYYTKLQGIGERQMTPWLRRVNLKEAYMMCSSDFPT